MTTSRPPFTGSGKQGMESPGLSEASCGDIVRHTFLCQPGLWNATGVYLDPTGKESRASGTTRVTHEQGRWRVDGVVELQDNAGDAGDGSAGTGGAADCLASRYETACRMDPFPDNGFQTEWKAESPVFGPMRGICLQLADVLVSTGESNDGRFVLSEWLERIDPDHYVGRGVILDHGQRVAAWALHMERAFSSRIHGVEAPAGS